jgi:hypothetical protein
VARTFTKNTSNTFTTASGFFDNSTFGTGRSSGSGPTAITYSIWARARGTYAATATALTDGLCGLGFSSTAHITLKTDASGNLGSSSRAYYFDSDQVGYTTYKLPTERWVHLVAIFHFASRRVRYFADGVFVGSTSASGWSLDRIDTFTNAGSLRIGQAGNQSTTTSTQFAGDLAHFAVWNRQLTETEIGRISKGLDPRVLRPRVYYPLTSLNAGEVVVNVVAPMCQGTIAGSLPVTNDPIAISANLQPYLLAIKAASGAPTDYAVGVQGITTGAPVVDQITATENTGAIDYAIGAQDITAGTPVIGQLALVLDYVAGVQDVANGVPVVDQITAATDAVLAPQGILAGAPVIDQITVTENTGAVDYVVEAQDIATGAPVVDQVALVLDYSAATQEVLAGASTIEQILAATEIAAVVQDMLAGAPNITAIAVTSTGSGGAADPAAVWNYEIISGFTAERLLRILAASVAGKVSGAPSNPVFRSVDDSQDQIYGTVDASGNRTAVSYGP